MSWKSILIMVATPPQDQSHAQSKISTRQTLSAHISKHEDLFSPSLCILVDLQTLQHLLLLLRRPTTYSPAHVRL